MSFVSRKDEFIVWVLAPFIETTDPNLQYYYDYTQSIAEYQKVFQEIGCEWKWQNTTLAGIDEALHKIKNYPTSKTPIVINLCDGDELNGIPGISVIHKLEALGMAYTGSDDFFYRITTSKIPMKQAFDQHHVATARWKVIDPAQTTASEIFREIGETVIVKPAISAGSMGLSIHNVVSTEAEYDAILKTMQEGYRGWKLDTGGIFVEEFVNGPEYTTLVVGSSSDPSNLHCYPAVERVFHDALPEKEQFLSFDRLWETYDNEAQLPDQGFLYNYRPAEAALNAQLEQLSLQAFQSVGGTGYGRLDIRMNRKTGALYVLEVNAQCGLSEDENYTSIGAILRFAKKSFTYLVIEIIEDAMKRYGAKHKATV
jgi:D-alanine-D-alanine ligase